MSIEISNPKHSVNLFSQSVTSSLVVPPKSKLVISKTAIQPKKKNEIKKPDPKRFSELVRLAHQAGLGNKDHTTSGRFFKSCVESGDLRAIRASFYRCPILTVGEYLKLEMSKEHDIMRERLLKEKVEFVKHTLECKICGSCESDELEIGVHIGITHEPNLGIMADMLEEYEKELDESPVKSTDKMLQSQLRLTWRVTL